MIKAVFFDFDGTIFSHTIGRIPESTKRVLAQLKGQGIRIYLATGRHILEMEEWIADQVSFDGYITLNGQLCLNEKKEVIFDFPIAETDLKIMLPVFKGKELPVMFVEQNKMYINCLNEDVAEAQKAISTPSPVVGEYSGGKVYQFIVYDEGGAVNQLAGKLPNCKMSRWNRYAVDIISRTGGKSAGIQCYLEREGILPSEIMAFGDGENDISMLEFAGIGIAMGNAEKEVKEAADYVTTHIDEDGIATALKHFDLI